jgi:DNA-binding response OmpR family regulator
MRILLVSNDKSRSSLLKKHLQAECHSVDGLRAADEPEFLAEQVDYDLIIFDARVKGGSGLPLLGRVLAKKKPSSLALVITNGNADDRIKALDMGADDCISSLFTVGELSARVRALLRRRENTVEKNLQFEDLEVDLVRRTVKRAGRGIELTQKEFSLLLYFMRNPYRPLSRAMILEHVWDLSFDTFTNVVDVYVNYLRKKINAFSDRKLIETVRGVGYQLGEST